MEEFDWPSGVPYPEVGLKIDDPEQKGTFDLVCMAGGYVFAHEVRHSIFEQSGNSPENIMDEERACDRWALSLMLDKVANYADENGWAPSDLTHPLIYANPKVSLKTLFSFMNSSYLTRSGRNLFSGMVGMRS